MLWQILTEADPEGEILEEEVLIDLKCTKQFVISAGKIVKFLLDQPAVSLYIVMIVLIGQLPEGLKEEVFQGIILRKKVLLPSMNSNLPS